MSEYDDILFKGEASGYNGASTGFLDCLYKNLTQWAQSPTGYIEYNKLKIIDVDITNKKYFLIGSTIPTSQCNFQFQTSSVSYMFKNYIVDIHRDSYQGSYVHGDYRFGDIKINIIKHNIPNNILFAIKHFQYQQNFTSIIDIYNTHPEYLTTHIEKNISNEFQKISIEKQLIIEQKKELDKLLIEHEQLMLNEKQLIIEQKEELDKLLIEHEQLMLNEKQLIIEQKKELDKLILENHEKINYYKSLESQIISISNDKNFITEEKRKLAIVKEKMAKNKREFDNEKLKFLIEKDSINDFDIDKFINSVMD